MTHDYPHSLPPPFPSTSSYTPRSEYEASTPQTFFTAREVLYAELGSCDICISKPAVHDYETWRDFFGDDAPAQASDDETTNIRSEVWAVKRQASGFVGSGYLTLLPHEPVVDPQAQPITSTSSKPSSGVQIPYPSIHLHAVRVLRGAQIPLGNSSSSAADAAGAAEDAERAALYLQIEMGPLPGTMADEDDPGQSVVEVLLIPETPPVGAGGLIDSTPVTSGSAANATKVQELYGALSTCQDLHPDPGDSDSDDEHGSSRARGGLAGLLQGMGGGEPGEGGWITSENAHLFEGQFPVEVGQMEPGAADDDGDLVPLGPGAGTRRQREDEHGAEDALNGHAGTANGVEETKWQRTVSGAEP